MSEAQTITEADRAVARRVIRRHVGSRWNLDAGGAIFYRTTAKTTRYVDNGHHAPRAMVTCYNLTAERPWFYCEDPDGRGFVDGQSRFATPEAAAAKLDEIHFLEAACLAAVQGRAYAKALRAAGLMPANPRHYATTHK